MKTHKELKKEQERLNKELVECPRCKVICEWGELMEGAECGECFFKDKDRGVKPQKQ